MLLQLRAGANARQHQQLGDSSAPALSSTSRRGAHLFSCPPWRYSTPTAAPVQQHARGLRAGDDLQVGPRQVRREVALGGAVAFAILVGDLVQAHAFWSWRR